MVTTSIIFKKHHGGNEMKLFASDYDGTFYKGDIDNLNKNIEAVNRWREAGNQFTFATGRGITSLKNEISGLDLSYDYIIGLNGAVIVDKDDNLIYQATIKSEVASSIISYIIKENFLSFMISDGFTGTLNVAIQDETLEEMERSLHDKNTFNLPLIESLLRPISQISIIGLTQEEVKSLFAKLSNIFYTEVIIYPNRTSIDIAPKHTSKANGIQQLLDKTEVNINEVYCIGDSWNDTEMIKRFNGYVMENSPNEIKSKGSRIFNSVALAIESSLQNK